MENIRIIASLLGLLVVFSACQPSSGTHFQLHAPEISGIDFVNEITENDTLNILESEFVYNGAGIAVGDLNGDGLEDLFFAGNQVANRLYLNKGGLKFEDVTKSANIEKPLPRMWSSGVNILDVNLDGKLDIYVCNTLNKDSSLLRNLLYINQGNDEQGRPGFREMAAAYGIDDPSHSSHAQFFDYDRDGDLDLFVGSRILPNSYPLPDRSYLLRNDSKGEAVRFTDVTEAWSVDLVEPGLISDALWTDFNGDQRPDLVLAGEWMPLRLFQNKGDSFREITAASGLAEFTGWWNSLARADLDQDGDMDYIAGNFGENIYYQCTSEEPVRVYGKDLDQNGTIDPLISCYWQDSLGKRDEYLYHPRADLVKQFVGIRKKFNTHGEYGEATVSGMFTEEEMADALILEARWMKSAVIENLGDGQFALHALPVEAQLAPIYGILPKDVNEDGQMDILLVGNDFGMEVQQGRADAFTGLVLLNEGGFRFRPLSIAEGHFTVMGEARALVALPTADGRELILASQHRDSLKVYTYQRATDQEFVPLQAGEVKAVYYLKNGKQQLEEFYWGDSFMSQCGRYVAKTKAVDRIELLDAEGAVSRVIGNAGEQ